MLEVRVIYTDGFGTKFSMSFMPYRSRKSVETMLYTRHKVKPEELWKVEVTAKSEDEDLNALIDKVDWGYLYDQDSGKITMIITLETVEEQIKVLWMHIKNKMLIEDAIPAVTNNICTLWDSDRSLFYYWIKENAVSDYLLGFIREDEALSYAYPSREILKTGRVIVLNW